MNSRLNSITEIDLNKLRTLKKERGAIGPQFLLTLMLCLGTTFFGNVINWGEVSIEHLKSLQYEKHQEQSDFTWILCAGPLGISIGILIWGFITRRIGPKKALIVTTPFLLLSWFLKAYYNTYKIYNSSQVLAGVSVASYYLTGEVLLTECIHRRNLKFCHTCFQSSVMLGVLEMNVCSTFISKKWLCIGFASAVVVYFVMLISLPDSPHHLIQKSELAAEKSLKFYSGKSSVAPELNVVRQHMNIFGSKFTSYNHMLSSKVIIKSFVIIAMVQFFKIWTGYYIFLFDSFTIFKHSQPFLGPYEDNILFGVALFISKFCSTSLHLFGNYGIRKSIIISMCICTIILFTMGVIEYLASEKILVPMDGTRLLMMSLFVFTYDLGLGVCPDIMLYAYTPYQLYAFLTKLMLFVQWILVFLLTLIYMNCKKHLGLHGILWMFTCVTVIGCIFTTLFVVEIKGKSLTTIQMELGGNPVGTRGSTRQRIPCPFESTADMFFLENLIAADLARNRRPHRLTRLKSFRR